MKMKLNSYKDQKQPKDFFIRHAVSTALEMKYFHYHDMYEIYFGLSDGPRIFIEDKIYEVKRGNIFILSPLVLHRTVSPLTLTYERCIISFNAEYIESFIPSSREILAALSGPWDTCPPMAHLSEEEIGQLDPLLKRAQHFINTPLPRQDMYKKLTLMDILLFIDHCFHARSPEHTVHFSSDYSKIKHILDYISENLAGDLSLNHLTHKFFISKTYLENLFKACIGFTVTEYIISRRMSRAQELLRKNLPVMQVCEFVGCKDYTNFIRMFTRIVGISPKQYSKKYVDMK